VYNTLTLTTKFLYFDYTFMVKISFRLPFIFLLNGEREREKKRIHLRKLPQTLETFIYHRVKDAEQW
jgi:hypothetical protein